MPLTNANLQQSHDSSRGILIPTEGANQENNAALSEFIHFNHLFSFNGDQIELGGLFSEIVALTDLNLNSAHFPLYTL